MNRNSNYSNSTQTYQNRLKIKNVHPILLEIYSSLSKALNKNKIPDSLDQQNIHPVLKQMVFNLIDIKNQLQFQLNQKNQQECSNYELSLQKLQGDIRQHIRIEQEMKIYTQNMQSRLEETLNKKQTVQKQNQELKKSLQQSKKALEKSQEKLKKFQKLTLTQQSKKLKKDVSIKLDRNPLKDKQNIPENCYARQSFRKYKPEDRPSTARINRSKDAHRKIQKQKIILRNDSLNKKFRSKNKQSNKEQVNSKWQRVHATNISCYKPSNLRILQKR